MKLEKNKSKTVQGTFGRMQQISEDFLPRPEDLVLRPKPVRVTLTLDVDTLDFFKKHAKKLKVPYQRMIRNLLNEYRNRITT